MWTASELGTHTRSDTNIGIKPNRQMVTMRAPPLTEMGMIGASGNWKWMPEPDRPIMSGRSAQPEWDTVVTTGCRTNHSALKSCRSKLQKA